MSNDEEKSFIYIEFEEVGSVNVTSSQFENVTAFQLLAMAGSLEFEGKNYLAMERAAQMRAEMNKPQIAVPTPKIEIGK